MDSLLRGTWQSDFTGELIRFDYHKPENFVSSMEAGTILVYGITGSMKYWAGYKLDTTYYHEDTSSAIKGGTGYFLKSDNVISDPRPFHVSDYKIVSISDKKLDLFSIWGASEVTFSRLSDSAKQENNTLTGTWKFLYFFNRKTGLAEDTDAIQDGSAAFYKNVQLTFNESAIGTGIFQGHSFCNHISGKYKIDSNDALAVFNFDGTKMNCLYEDDFGDAMRNASSYVVNNDALYLLYNKDTEELVFKQIK